MNIQKIRRNLVCGLTLLLLISSIQPLIAQQSNIRFEHLSWTEGLSQVTVRSIIQDKRGFMWFGTDDGLNKYNGYNFTVYRHISEDSGSLSSNQVTKLFEDSRGVLWIGTKSGLNSFNRDLNTFKSYYHKAGDKNSLSNNLITAICEDAQGRLWIGTSEGLNLYDRKAGTFTHVAIPEDSTTLSNNTINALASDKVGNLWIGTDRGLFYFDVAYQNFHQYKYNAANLHSLSNNKVTSLFINKHGKVWIGTLGGLNSFNPQIKKITRHVYNSDKLTGSENLIFSVLEDSNGKIWIGTNGSGVMIFDPTHGKFTHHLQDSESPHSLSQNSVIDVYIDKSGSGWLGTQAGGINKLNIRSQKFRTFQQIPNSGNSLQGNNIWGVLEDQQGLLWIATDQGLNNYDKNTKKWTHYSYHENATKGLNSKAVLSVFEDKSGLIWIGTGGGLSKFNKTTGKFTHYRHDPDNPYSISHNVVWQVLEDEKGKLWVATLGGGLNKFDKKTERFTHYKHDPSNANSLSNDMVWSVTIEKKGILWIGTNGSGLTRFDENTKEFTHYVHEPEVKNSLSNNYIYSLLDSEDGILWIGTNGGGLNKFDKSTGAFTVYQEKDGLNNNVIYGILKDHTDHLWLSTNKGLSRFNPRTGNFKNYDARDGLQSNEFNVGANFRNSAGELFFGGINGLNVFHPDSIKDNLEIPSIIITDFQIFNESVDIGGNSPLQKHISETAEITLSYRQSVITFEFVALNYISSEKNQYAYMLEGFDTQWYNVGNRRFATYTNIPPGTYTFRVKASNNDGIWNEEGKSIILTVVPPFWKTIWFYLLVILVLILLILTIFHLRLKSLQRIRKMLEIQVNEQTRQLSQEKELVLIQNQLLNNINEELTSTLDNLQNTQIQLVQSEKMASLGQLTAGVAHEINNPINFISAGIDSLKANYEDIIAVFNKYRVLKENGNNEELVKEIDLLEKEVELPELFLEINHLFKGVKDGTNRTKEIVKSLQSFSRLDEDSIKKANLNEGIEATLVILQSNFADRIQLIKEYENLPEVECFPGQINQVFVNVLSNAIQAIEGKGIIRITTGLQGDNVVVKINDSGKGIPSEIMNKIFDPFFTTKDVGKGKGLGLSISYGIIAKHNGKLYASSSVEEGTTFTIELPLTVAGEKEG